MDSLCDRQLAALPDYSKKELVLKLLKLEWVESPARPNVFAGDEIDMLFWEAKTWGTKWYLVALAMAGYYDVTKSPNKATRPTRRRP